MKKSFISLAVAAGLAVSGAAQAAPTAYGFIDVSLFDVSPEVGADPEINLTSTTSAFGLKGSEDLGDGMKAIYKVEFQYDIDDRNQNIVDRDQWVGLKGGFGKVIFGTASSNYKQMGGKIDPFYRTPAQARSRGGQSTLHAGAGDEGGRMSSMVQYTSPKMGGVSAVANITFSGSSDEASGLGLRYEAKGLKVWLDTLSGKGDGSGNALGGSLDSATKIGGMYSMDNLTFGAQIESIDTLGGGEVDVTYLMAMMSLDKANTVAINYGITDDVNSMINVGIWHALSKKTCLYAAYHINSDEEPGAASSGANDDGFTAWALGMRKKF